MDQERRIRIVSTGAYMPRNAVPSSFIDGKLGKKEGWTRRVFGIDKRHFADAEETTSFMAARAAQAAIAEAGIDPGEIDCIIAACGVAEQPIPCTAVMVQNKLGLGASGIPAFDINSTCSSFVTAMDAAADAIALGRYGTVLIVSSDIASCGLDWSHPESAAIFGDGSAAVIISRSADHESSRLIASGMESYGAFQDTCRLEAGGTRISPHREADAFWDKTMFRMNGREALSCVLEHMPEFLAKLYRKAGVSQHELDLMILHQGSSFSLNAVQKHLGLDPSRLVALFRQYGNQIATSIPHGLHRAVADGRLKRGNRFMLLGTSAGISFGGMILEY